MGLLDMFGTSAEDPRTMATLQLAAGLLGAPKGGGMQGLLAGMQGYTGTMAQAKEAERRKRLEEQDRAMKQQLQEAQLQEYRAQAMQRMAASQQAERQAADQQRIGGLLQSAVSPVRGIEANSASGITGPRPEALSVVGKRPPIDYQTLIAQGVPDKTVKALSEAADYGKTKVARVVDSMENGRPVQLLLDDFGNVINKALPQWKAPIQADTGGQINFLDPVSLSQLQQFNKTMTPDGKASNAVAWANNSLARQRLALDQQNAGQLMDLPGGVVRVNGNVATPVMAPGSPTPLMGKASDESKSLTEAQAKATSYLGQMRAATTVLDKLGANQSKLGQQVDVSLAGGPLNYFTGQTGQRVAQAQNQWSEAFLRFKTGAAATPGEVALNSATFFPKIGDDAATIEQKRLMRMQAEADMETAAGRGAAKAKVIPEINAIQGAKQQAIPGLDMSAIEAEIRRRNLPLGGM